MKDMNDLLLNLETLKNTFREYQMWRDGEYHSFLNYAHPFDSSERTPLDELAVANDIWLIYTKAVGESTAFLLFNTSGSILIDHGLLKAALKLNRYLFQFTLGDPVSQISDGVRRDILDAEEVIELGFPYLSLNRLTAQLQSTSPSESNRLKYHGQKRSVTNMGWVHSLRLHLSKEPIGWEQLRLLAFISYNLILSNSSLVAALRGIPKIGLWGDLLTDTPPELGIPPRNINLHHFYQYYFWYYK